MPDAIPPDKPIPCAEAIKKAYAVSDALYDVTNAELIGEERATVLALLTEARNLAVECGCEALVDEADKVRIAVAEKKALDQIRNALDQLKNAAKQCMKPAAA
jgi:hypothetical protein